MEKGGKIESMKIEDLELSLKSQIRGGHIMQMNIISITTTSQIIYKAVCCKWKG